MKLNLTTWQRLQLLMLMNSVQGDLRTINKALKLIDLLEMGEDEQEEVSLRSTPTGFTWDDPNKRWDIEVKDRNLVTFLKQKVELKQDWPAVSGREVLDLCEQLNIKLEDEGDKDDES